MNNRGVTLIELMVVVGIVGILIVALAFSYQGWQGRYKVEGAIKTLYTDLMNAKAQAMTKDHIYIVSFPDVTSYRLIEDTNDSGAYNAGDTIVPTFPKTVPYSMHAYSYNGPAAGAVMTAKTLTNVVINFDNKGHMSSQVLLVNPENPVDTTTKKVITGVISLTAGPTDDVGKMQADYDCLVISPTKIDIGQMQMQGAVWRCNVK